MRFYTQRQIISWLPYFLIIDRNFFLDVSTGSFLLLKQAEYIDKLLQNFSPSEVLIKNNKNDFKENFGDDHCFFI
jgi:DNA mismatch repair ATPase MutS